MFNKGYRKENPVTSGIVYQHMSNHYRRILNAKPAVDTKTPQSFKSRIARSGQARKSQPAEWLSSKSACHGSLTHFDEIHDNSADLWLYHRKDHYGSLAKSLQPPRNSKYDLLELNDRQVETSRMEFWPRILKSEVRSKVKDMRVYHPPRRKSGKDTWAPNKIPDETVSCACAQGNSGKGECIKEASQASSRDSAYNGGTSSTPECPSPIPQHPTSIKNVATQTDQKSRARQLRHKSVARQDDDYVYVKFIHDITVEAVENGHFTDKSLSRIIKKHIEMNMGRLDKIRMLREVGKLREQLGISRETNDEPKHFARATSQDIDDLDSWTSHYFQLMGIKQPKDDRAQSEKTVTKDCHKCESDSESSDDQKETNSSREPTIKEAIPTGEESASDSELDESIQISDSGSSATG